MTPEQCRAARAMLGVTQTQLANAARVGLSTVVDFEKARRPVSNEVVDAIRAILEANGITFLDETRDGVGLRCRNARHAQRVSRLIEKRLISQDAIVNINYIKRPKLVSIRQIKAARALLGWSQSELARHSGVSAPTIARLESADGDLGGREGTAKKIQAAIEAGGAEFIDEDGGGAGVRLKKSSQRKSGRS
jgi:transcriptional regulator with XRE-family HTH domain